jgi:hypothetical protein
MRRLLEEREIAAEGIVAPGRGSAASAKQAGSGRGARAVTVNLAESPVTWLHARGHLSDREFAAGEQLRRDFEAAQLAPSISMRWDGVRVKGGANSGLHASERQIAAKARFDGALEAAGKGLGDVLWRVVCAGEALVDAEKALTWPARSGKLVLKLALERVADYHRLP